MYKYSMTQWILGNEEIENSFMRLKKYGYDCIEFAAEPYSLDANLLCDLMNKYDIGCSSLCGIFTEERDLTADTDSKLAETAIKYVKDCIDFAKRVGAPHIIVVPSPVGISSLPTGKDYNELWNNAVNNISSIAGYALENGVKICIEAINRYETYFLNTLAKAYKFVKEVNHPAVCIMADLFHMSLEENNIGNSLRMISDKLIHVHIADNTREAAGLGTTDFKEVVYTLKDIGYTGSLTMEFMPRVANPYEIGSIETKGHIMDKYAEQSINYMKTVEKSVV
jgi:sugar phosphate isomerase/epimerase